MDLVRLNNTTYLPEDLIEEYTTLIWTERFQPTGDFQLKTTNVKQGLIDLPERSLVSLLDTSEVMIVENQSISLNSDGFPELTVTGRSFDSFLENRYLSGPYNLSFDPELAYADPRMTLIGLLWNAAANDSTFEWTTGGPGAYIGHDPRDAINNFAVSESNLGVGSPTGSPGKIKAGIVYSQIVERLALWNLGLRTIRPNSRKAEIWFLNALDAGFNFKYPEAFSTKMLYNLYKGTDRSVEQTINPNVIFDVAAEHIIDPEYLFSSKEYKNIAAMPVPYPNSTGWTERSHVIFASRIPEDKNTVGFSRRYLWLDAGTIDNPQDYQAYLDSAVYKGSIELLKYNKTVLFDGSVSKNAPYVYNKDYALGDIVTMRGDYGLSQKMLVMEHIRSQSENDEVEYPGLAVWTAPQILE